MKILIFIILISSTFSLNSKLEPSLYNISAITTALSDVINKYIAEENLLLNISIFGNQTALENDIIDKTLSKVKYKLRIEHIKENENKKRGVQNSLFILGQESFLENINKKLTFIHQAPQKHKIFIYIKNLKVFEVVDFLFEINRERQIDHFLYFVHDFGNKIDLVTYEWFTETRCNNKTKIIINTFDKLKLKWKKPLEKYEKFRNLHDCKIVAMQFSSSYKDSFNKTKGHAFEVGLGKCAHICAHFRTSNKKICAYVRTYVRTWEIQNMKDTLKIIPFFYEVYCIAWNLLDQKQ
ncbi:hypothetical protein PVAND_016669 [Polypedilum vanderplanki]|uniref:Putative ionotropic receptor ligand binding domain-containing protein n=1 Tax=Polypedilum vanderplanki TaxID=319348 RepID=A0A9J6BH02_POLVA|nr:hypothetical protein PVAND_016669 [Polypedilum vanderplanki]